MRLSNRTRIVHEPFRHVQIDADAGNMPTEYLQYE